MKWCTSCLLDIPQFVKIGNTSSKFMNIKCGVPYGCILVELLFLIIVNDIDNVSDLTQLIIFADTTNVYLKTKSLDDLIK